MKYQEFKPEKIDSRTVPRNPAGMFKTKCANCGNPMYAYAKDKMGTLPVVYCCDACEANSKYDSKWKR